MMRRTLLCGTMLLASALSGVESGSAVEPTEIASIVERWAALGMSPGMGVAVVQGDELVYVEDFGTADLETGEAVTPDTRFYIASTSKAFLGLCAAVLHVEGRIDLDAPVTKYLPELVLRSPADADAITLRDLLSLRHGLEDGGPVVFRTAFSGEFTPAKLIRLLADYGPGEQGRSFNYGNLGYNIAGLALEAATGLAWQDLVEETVLEPAGMASTTARPSTVEPGELAMPHRTTPTGFERVPKGKTDATMHAAGGHVATMADLGRFLMANLNQGTIAGVQVFDPRAIAMTHEQEVAQDRDFGPYHRHGWGLGWDLGTYDGELLIHRFGSYSGFRSHLSFMPERGLGVAVQVNDGMLGSFLADQVADAIYDHLLGKEDAPSRLAAALERSRQMVGQARAGLAQELEKRAARSQALPLPVAAYVGRFENAAWGTMEWTLEEGRLCLAMGVARSCAEVYDAGAHQLRVEITGGGEVVTFEVAEDQVVAATYQGARFDRVSG